MNSGTDSLELFEAPFDNDLASWGATLVVAPHPDDEALGCGGALARLADLGARIGVVWVSDGAASHPGSRKFPPRALAMLRQSEALAALAALGLPAGCATFMELPDGAVPFEGDARFARALANARRVLRDFAPQTLVLPWRRDPHRDHRASWQLWAHAAREQGWTGRVLEYLVWAFERGARQEWPRADEATAFRVDVGAVLARKKAAIHAHASQVTHLIDDAPNGFWLSPEVIAHFERASEIYVAPHDFSPAQGKREKPAFEP